VKIVADYKLTFFDREIVYFLDMSQCVSRKMLQKEEESDQEISVFQT